MVPTKHTLAIMALTTTLVSCSGQSSPATMPTTRIEALHIQTTSATYPLTVDLTSAYTELNPRQAFDIQVANYQSLMAQLQNGDIAYFISNHLSLESGLWAAAIGQDAIVIIVHPGTGIAGLTTDQLRAIYQGQIIRWNDLGGSDQPIVVFSRESGSGTRAEFERMVMGDRRTTANATVASSSSHMIERVGETPGSIGYVSMGYLDDQVTALSIDGVYPTRDQVTGNVYPLRATIFVLGLEEPEGTYRSLIGWMQSPSGQAVVAQRYAPLTGFLDITPDW